MRFAKAGKNKCGDCEIVVDGFSPSLSGIELERVVQLSVEEADFSFILCVGTWIQSAPTLFSMINGEKKTNRFRQKLTLQNHRPRSIRHFPNS
jgi:hypothetical protein